MKSGWTKLKLRGKVRRMCELQVTPQFLNYYFIDESNIQEELKNKGVYKTFDESGHLIKEEVNGRLNIEYVYKEGILTKEIRYNKEGSVIYTLDFYYDKLGNLIESRGKDISQENYYIDRYKYEGKNIIEHKTIFPGGSTTKVISQYNTTGKLIKEVFFNDNRIVNEKKIDYISNTSIIIKDIDDRLKHQVLDNKDRIIKSVEYIGRDFHIKETEYNFKYNDMGDMILREKMDFINNIKTDFDIVSEYKYDQYGNITECISTTGESKSLICRTFRIFEYY